MPPLFNDNYYTVFLFMDRQTANALKIGACQDECLNCH